VGEAEKRLREIFKRGRQVSPCIIFFDEVDSVTRSRNTGQGSPQGLENLTNQLLTLIDGIEQYEDVIVIGATNRPEIMDEAFMRKGRFDRLIYVPPPDKDERFSILRIHTRKIPLASDVDLKYLSENTKNFSGADIEGLCQEAAIEAFREDPEARFVGANHFENALLRLKPSISKETIKYYNTINKRLSGRVTSGDVDVHPYGYG
jgi:transitional endoplasmic reticulum ATPase